MQKLSIITAWKRVDAWLLENAPEVYQSLRPGATDEQIQHAEAVLGVAFPDDVRASYTIHDGQVFGENADPNGYGFLNEKEFFLFSA